ncbi:sensor histidine kinase [Acidaminobacter sp. JC074]|uniref:sensor histidine kinase n=1 Tax=Acidaminobacter sp. JC074 TaxID=2530199 RepID=UPI001F0DB454|nr:histidine kinase [Acidaminobacter sp. JC074]
MKTRASIKRSLILFSASIIVLMTLLSLYSLGIMNRYKDQVSTMFENHIYLNDIEEKMTTLDENLLGYLSTKSSTRLNDFLIGLDALDETLDDFYKKGISHNELMMKNVTNLIQQYKTESDLAITYKRQRNVIEYYKHYEKSNKIKGFIFEYIDRLNRQQIETNSVAYTVLLKQTQILQIITNVIIVDLIVFSTLIVYMLILKMIRPINALYQSAEEISSGNFETQDVIIESNDEYRMLAEAFNQMKNNIVKHIDDVKLQAEIEARLQDEQMKNLKMAYLLDNAKLSALQSQINPHFLFNTINAGVQLSVIENASKTGEFLETMSRLFRYNMKMQQDHCTLKDELQNIKDYYELLKVRFRDRIKFEFDVDEDLLTLSMPPMILQPLVENSYIHGLSSLEAGGTIFISCIRREGFIDIAVSDNGIGMDASTIEKILNSEDSENIGMKNVKDRLELFYHLENLMTITSKEGVTVTIRLPIEVLHV